MDDRFSLNARPSPFLRPTARLRRRPRCSRHLGSALVAIVAALAPGCTWLLTSADTTAPAKVPIVVDHPLPDLCEIDIACPVEIPDNKVRCTFALRDAAGKTLYDDYAGVEIRGRTTQFAPKKNYSVELRNKDGDEKPTAWLGLGQESDWILDGSWVDRSLVRNQLAADLYRSLERWAPRGRFCRLSLDGAPRGIYRLVERVKRDRQRLALAKDESFLIKQGDHGWITWEISELQTNYRLIYPRERGMEMDDITAVQRVIDELDAALRATEGDAVFDLVDLDAAVDFVLLQELTKNIDAYQLSLHLYRNAGGKIAFVPWDFDLAMGVPSVESVPTHDFASPQGWIYKRTALIDGLARVPAFRERLAQRWASHREGPWRDEAITEHLDDYVRVLEPGLAENFELWPLAKSDVSRLYDKFSSYTPSSHDDEMQRLRSWLVERAAWIDDHVATYPAGESTKAANE